MPISLRPLALPAAAARGRLWLGPMPGRAEGWAAFTSTARDTGLTLVVCLTPREEVAACSPQYHAAIVQGRLPFRWLHLPMRNFGLADELHTWREGVDAVSRGLMAGESVLLHCAEGIGRTGTTAACVLKRLGVDAASALQQVRRAGSNPQSAAQSGLIDTF